VKVCPDAASVADENGDTAIHSAAAFSSGSLSLVLKHLTDKTKIDLMNRNGMRPSHLALNLQVSIYIYMYLYVSMHCPDGFVCMYVLKNY
jgi:hypothetical protein